jgi:phage-related protein
MRASEPTLGYKPIAFVGSALDDLRDCPDEVRSDIGFALWDAQCGGKSALAKPLKGFGGAGVLEIVEAFDGDAYRAVYTVQLAGRVYVLHVFQKKSRRDIETPKADLDLIRQRLQRAHEMHKDWLAEMAQRRRP